jgi:Glycosyltransferase family 87
MPLEPGFLRRAVLALAVVQAACQLGAFLPAHWNRRDPISDRTVYYVAARAVVRGEPLYHPIPDYGPHKRPDVYLYPPSFAAALTPVAYLPFQWYSRLWYVLLLVAYWVYAVCLARLYDPRVTARSVLVAGLALAVCPGAYWGMSLGQVDPILWALFGVGLVAAGARGAALSAAALIKLYAVWPLAAAAVREGKRVILPAAALVAASLALGAVACGVQAYVEWARVVLPIVGQGTFNPDNVSLSMLGLRLASRLGWSYTAGPLPQAARLYLTFSAVAGPVAVWWFTRRRSTALQYGALGLAGALFSPLCWSSYLPLVLAPLAVWLGERFGPGERSGRVEERKSGRVEE